MSVQRLGVDEAGRGPVLGPMVMAGLCVPESDLPKLAELGVQDSKLFGASAKAKKQRKELSEQLKMWPHRIEVADSDEVDRWVRGNGLNELERAMASRILKDFPEAQVMLDGAGIFGALCTSTVQAQNKADQDYLEVAGASIIAKHLRDELMTQLLAPFEETFGKVSGGGYANAGSLKFVAWYHEQTGRLPSFYRHSYQWKAAAHLR